MSGHIEESVERPLRYEASDARHFLEASADQIAPGLKLAPHAFDTLLIALDGRQRRVLADTARTTRLLALDITHRFHDGNGAQRPADAPAGHGISLASATDGNGALRQSGTQGGETGRMSIVEHQPFVNLVADDGQVFLQYYVGQRFQLFACIDGTGRIVRG